nr:MAG TPA: hypothetical protein [Caudoviricetes sp.]
MGTNLHEYYKKTLFCLKNRKFRKRSKPALLVVF